MNANGPEVAADGTLLLDSPVALPEVLDILIVGGGPFGTAAAFRAKELGLSALVIDYDDLMKRIRDYAKDKLILPDFGGGDLMEFPDGGNLTRSLHFGPIDKDEMCRQWKGFYRTFNVPAQVGVEMTGLEREGSAWVVKCWNHRTLKEQSFRAKHVVLAFGRGVPRRLDVPGGTEGLAFALNDATNYIGQPVCVIGGGTSAAEAVIAVSNAKTSATDGTAVYWSYRAAQMPKVSKALADVFFDAFVRNGNVRYLPNSEPTAMIEMEGDQYLALRTGRAPTADGPMQSTLLEFRKRYCIACIGEDIPRALMQQIGVPLVTGGPANKERVVVSPALETRQTNVYLAGDILSPAYFETTKFDSDPALFTEMKRRGNIKASLRDGVLIAEVVKKRLEGGIGPVTIRFVKGDLPKAPDLVSPATMPPQPAVAVAPCRLVAVLPTGVDADEYTVKRSGTTTIGRIGADISFQNDSSLADIHAEIVALGGDRFAVVDKGSTAGLFVQPVPGRIVDADPETVVHAGRQWLIVGEKSAPQRVVHFDASGQRQGAYTLKSGQNLIGRQSPDITIAPDDGSLSRRHLSITVKDGKNVLKDVGSGNGTQIKVRKQFELKDGDRILLGRQVLRFDDERTKSVPPITVNVSSGSDTSPALPRVDDGKRNVPPPPPPAPPKPVAPPQEVKPPAPPPVQKAAPPPPPKPDVAAAGGEPSINFVGLRTISCSKNQTICEAAEKNGIPIKASCHEGLCGEDAVRVVSGRENLTAAGQTERDQLEDSLSLEVGPYRLACMARVTGPVTIELLKQK
jgi:thioredoxin reductase/ferredoxin/pSer/pThr/pTyr-binding forkhead associated (FHA) protein